MILSCFPISPGLKRLSRIARVSTFTGFLVFCFAFNLSAGVKREVMKAVKPADIEVTGRVSDEKGEPVSGASVVVKGGGTGTSTDAAGNFKILVPNGKSVLVVSSVGYSSKEITVGTSGIVSVVLTRK